MLRLNAPLRLSCRWYASSPLGGWQASAVQGEGVVVRLDFEVVFVDAGQFRHDRDAPPWSA